MIFLPEWQQIFLLFNQMAKEYSLVLAREIQVVIYPVSVANLTKSKMTYHKDDINECNKHSESVSMWNVTSKESLNAFTKVYEISENKWSQSNGFTYEAKYNDFIDFTTIFNTIFFHQIKFKQKCKKTSPKKIYYFITLIGRGY